MVTSDRDCGVPTQGSARLDAERFLQEHMPRWVRILVALICMAFIAAICLFDPSAIEASQARWGERALGMPVQHVVAAVGSILVLPFCWTLPHAAILIRQATLDGKRVQGKVGALMFWGYVSQIEKRHPDLKRSAVIAVLGMFYLFGVSGLVAWIFSMH